MSFYWSSVDVFRPGSHPGKRSPVTSCFHWDLGPQLQACSTRKHPCTQPQHTPDAQKPGNLHACKNHVSTSRKVAGISLAWAGTALFSPFFMG